jgi:hypothetical protein
MEIKPILNADDNKTVIGTHITIGAIDIYANTGYVSVKGICFPVPLSRQEYCQTNCAFWDAHPEAADVLLAVGCNLSAVHYQLTPTLARGDKYLAREMGVRFKSATLGRDYNAPLTGQGFNANGVSFANPDTVSCVTWEQWENLQLRNPNSHWLKTLRRNR